MENQSILSKNFIYVWIVGLSLSIAMGMTGSTFALNVNSLGGSAGFSGTATAIATIAGLISMPISGRLCDIRGRRIVMAVGNIIFSLGTLICVLAPSLVLLPFSKIVLTVGFATVNTATIAAIADVVPVNRLSEGMGYFLLGQAISSVIGPTLGLALINGEDFTLMYAFATIIILLGVPFSLLFRSGRIRRNSDLGNTAAEPSECLPEPESGLWKAFEKTAVVPSFIQLVMTLGVAGLMTFLTLFTTTMNIPSIGLFFLISAIAMTLSRIFVGKLSNRIGSLPILVPCLVLSIIAFVIISFSSHQAVFLSVAAITGLCNGVTMPILNSLAVKDAPIGHRGLASSTFNIASNAGMGFGATIWGLSIDLGGFSAMFLGSAVCLSFGVVLCLIFLKKDKAK